MKYVAAAMLFIIGCVLTSVSIMAMVGSMPSLLMVLVVPGLGLSAVAGTIIGSN